MYIGKIKNYIGQWLMPILFLMVDGVALSVQASQDQQNNGVKHPETGKELFSDKLSFYFEWSPPVPFKYNACEEIAKCFTGFSSVLSTSRVPL